MKHIKAYKIFEKKITLVDKKIQLLKDLALDLQDVGLTVDVLNGSYTDQLLKYSQFLYNINQDRGYIILGIIDERVGEYDIINSDIIKEFKESLKSYGMNWRGTAGGTYTSPYRKYDRFVGKQCCVFKFDKFGKNTNSPLIRESVSLDLEDIAREINYEKNTYYEIKAGSYDKSNGDYYKTFFDVYSRSIHDFQMSYRYRTLYPDQPPIEEISNVIVLSFRFGTDLLLYNDISEYVERCVEYMTSIGYYYILEPVWGRGAGLVYSLSDIDKIKDKEISSFHIEFWK